MLVIQPVEKANGYQSHQLSPLTTKKLSQLVLVTMEMFMKVVVDILEEDAMEVVTVGPMEVMARAIVVAVVLGKM